MTQGIIDLIITLYLGRSASAGAAVRVLRVLRVLRTVRVFRLLRYFTRLEPILRVIKLSLASLGWIVFLMFLLMTVYAIIGMHLFGNKVEFTSTPHSFNTYPEALFVGFSILIGRSGTCFSPHRAFTPERPVLRLAPCHHTGCVCLCVCVSVCLCVCVGFSGLLGIGHR